MPPPPTAQGNTNQSYSIKHDLLKVSTVIKLGERDQEVKPTGRCDVHSRRCDVHSSRCDVHWHASGDTYRLNWLTKMKTPFNASRLMAPPANKRGQLWLLLAKNKLSSLIEMVKINYNDSPSASVDNSPMS